MALTIPSNGVFADELRSVSIVNLGTATATTDIASVRLWKEAGGGATTFEPALDQLLALLNWTGTLWVNAAPLAEPITTSGLRTYVSFSVSNSPTDGTTFRANVPVGGIEVASGNDGPIDDGVSNPHTQSISTDPLITDLRDRGLLDTTLILWMGEFGRTPRINRSTGRDHFPAAWSTVISRFRIQPVN